MKIRQLSALTAIACLLGYGALLSAQAGQKTYDFTTDPTTDSTIVINGANTTPWQATGGNPGGFLALLYSVNSTAEVVVFPDIDAGKTVKAFTFECDLRVGNAQGNAGRPADGFSVSYARASDPVLANLPTSADANNMAAPGQPEDGTKTGIAIAFDTWQGNTLPDKPADVEGIIVRVDNVTVLEYPMTTRNGSCTDATSMQTGPYDDAYWTSGLADPMNPGAWAGLCWAHLKVNLDDAGKLTVTYKSNVVLNAYQTTFFPSAGRLVLAGRTGGANENTHFDNISITTVPSATALVQGATGLGDASGFTVAIGDSGASIVDPDPVKSGLIVKLDTNTIPASALTVAKTNDTITITYKIPNGALFAPNSTHSVTVSAKDTAGNAITGTRAFTAANYTIVDPSFALTDAEAAAAKKNPGFFVQLWALDRPSQDFPNNNTASEQALDGEWGANVGDLLSGGYNDQTQLIPNLLDESGALDYASGSVPGIPSLAAGYGTASTDNFAMAFYTALQFDQAGIYTFGVDSDDGFRTYVSTNELSRYQTGALQLGEFSGGRGTGAGTLYSFQITKPGLYPFRTTYEEGGGGYAVHWFSVNADGSHTAINDIATPGAIKAFRWIEEKRADIMNIRPGDGITAQPTNKISVDIVDGSITKYVAGSAKVSLDGADVSSQITATAGTGKTTITVSPVTMERDSTHTVTLTYNESTSPVTSRTNTFTFTVAGTTPALLPANSFWIEAEDFNYEGGKTKAEASAMPYLGGAYAGLAAINGVDYFNNDNFETTGNLYRNFDVPDLKTGGKSVDFYSNAGRYAVDRPGGVTMSVDYAIGWADSGEWYDYTRTVPAGVYTAYAVLSYGGDTLPDRESGSLGIVTAGATTSSQTVQTIGSFSGNGSGGWGTDTLVPMKTGTGAPAYYKFTGASTTLRFTVGSGDYDWFVLVPATNVPAVVSSVPGGRSIHRDGLTFTLNDFSTTVVTNTIKLLVDGADVTAKSTISKAGDVTTISLGGTNLLNSGTHAYSLSFADNGSPAKTTTVTNSFLVNPYGTPGIFLIEAEDFDYGGGKSNPLAGTTGKDVNVMPYTGGAYTNLSAVLNVDYSNNDALDIQGYRLGGPLDKAGTHVDIADNMGGVLGSDRGTWQMQQNFKIGWTDNADWNNYTRVFPTNKYEVWAALSHGDALGTPNDLRATLQWITAGAGTTNQTVTPLGRFNGPSAGGWSNNELVPLTDTNNVKQIVSIGGTNTIRFTMDSGDFDYFIFVPTSGGAVGGPKFTGITRNTDGTFNITWTGGGTLQSATSVLGPWAPVPGATSPYKFTPGAAKTVFARIVAP